MRIPSMAFAAILIATPVAVAQQTPEQPMVSDQTVRDAVVHEIKKDPAVPSTELTVAVSSGVVTLNGSVDNILAQERAVRLAETVRGVRSVVNLVTVDPPMMRADSQIARNVTRALFVDPAADSYELDVSVKDGHVTLSGTVESWDEKELAGTVAKGVAGVTGLTNDIDVHWRSVRPDTEIRHEVEQSLRWDPMVDDGLIHVDVTNGHVMLTGTVGSLAEKREARWKAWTAGVESVSDSGLVVARWARDEDLRNDKYVVRSDAEIAAAIDAALVRDPRVFSANVMPTVTGGVVTLSGTVQNLRARRAAEADVRNTVGVRSVENELVVRPAVLRADSAIRADVLDAYERDPYLERDDVAVTVFGGTVQLSGTVDSYFEKAQADDLASMVPGVLVVINRLDVEEAAPFALNPRVDTWPAYRFDWTWAMPGLTPQGDFLVQKRIEEELFWSPFVDADDVSVSVTNGVATLTGTVGSPAEKQAARDNAIEGGAILVHNNLKVSDTEGVGSDR